MIPANVEQNLAQMVLDETKSSSDKSKPKSFGRRDHLREIEIKVQAKWAENRAFEATPDLTKKKFLATFPYPYMNGFLHIGHGFSLTKAEFATRYHRLKGENALFPLAFHCTGMPIQAAANKLKHELETYGCPPDFGTTEVEMKKETSESTKQQPENKAKGKKTKLAAKTGKVVRQYDILKMMVPEEEIPKFKDPSYWLEYFPPYAQKDLTAFGANIDWRRSFITTDVNPFYDAFIRWQLNTLKAGNRVSRGKRPNVYSKLDQQICADHDRSSGEGVNPQEYTIVKLRVLESPYRPALSALDGYKNVFLAPATLRPETMYGQTNCFVLPEGQYGAYIVNDEQDVFIISKRAALNLAHQEYSRSWGNVECILTMTGSDLLGLPLKAPNAKYDVVYTLPLLTISMGKGTGVVTSVPSDAPDDFAALRDLKEKPALREKYNITDEMVLPFDPVPIIDIPGYGSLSAPTVCEQLKIKSQNDKDSLAKAKDLVYLKGFYEGVMTVGSQKGVKVCDAKAAVKKELFESNDAISYWEPESLVTSRTGDECVVAHLDQWYLMYGASDWKEKVLEHINNPETFNTYNPSALKEYNQTLEWLKEWAPCRQFGLGTKLPWDPQFVVESLSDSTIYMAYYTIAHLLQGNVDGSKAGELKISASDLTDEVFDYIFLKKEVSNCNIPTEKLEKLQSEFEYWYPVDLRTSAKDLMRNHLTMALYNHVEIWKDDPSKWPRSYFTNGQVTVNAEKMSKSKGNFLSLGYCIDEWGADCTRFACSNAGDSLDDANFSIDTANMGILRLTTEEEWIKASLEEIKDSKLRTGDYNFQDKVFENMINHQIVATASNFEAMQWRDGLQSCFFEFLIVRDNYREVCTRSGVPMHQDLILRYIEVQYVMLSPICPHFCEHVWELLGKEGFVLNASWPTVSREVDVTLLRAGEFLQSTVKKCRDFLQPKKQRKNAPVAVKPTSLRIYVAETYAETHASLLKFLRPLYDESSKSFPEDLMKQIKNFVTSDASLKPQMKNIMKVAAFIKSDALERGPDAFELSMPYDQVAVLTECVDYLQKALEMEKVEIVKVEGLSPTDPLADKKMSNAAPGSPHIAAIAP